MRRSSVLLQKFFTPQQPLKFNTEGKCLLYSTPSATVISIQTFLKVYAPINIGFIGIHVFFSLAEFFNPLVPGNN